MSTLTYELGIAKNGKFSRVSRHATHAAALVRMRNWLTAAPVGVLDTLTGNTAWYDSKGALTHVEAGPSAYDPIGDERHQARASE